MLIFLFREKDQHPDVEVEVEEGHNSAPSPGHGLISSLFLLKGSLLMALRS